MIVRELSVTRAFTALAAAAGFAGAAAGAQLPNASVGAFGMAGAYTAVARGADAVAWNPANLGIGLPVLADQ